MAERRPHTGRARNLEAKTAILDAAAALLVDAGADGVTIDRIAGAAGVGKQTIYRWWPSRGALLLDAMRARGRVEVPAPRRGALAVDLEIFVVETFRRARNPATAALLRQSMREALSDPGALAALQRFVEDRRRVLTEVFAKARDRDELAPGPDVDLMIDQ